MLEHRNNLIHLAPLQIRRCGPPPRQAPKMKGTFTTDASSPLLLEPRERDVIDGMTPLLRERLPGILTEFYGWLMARPDMAKLVTDSGKSPEQLAQKQFDHWMALIENGPDSEFEKRAACSDDFANEMMDSAVSVAIAVNESPINSVEMLHAIERVDQQAQTISAAVEETVTGVLAFISGHFIQCIEGPPIRWRASAKRLPCRSRTSPTIGQRNGR